MEARGGREEDFAGAITQLATSEKPSQRAFSICGLAMMHRVSRDRPDFLTVSKRSMLLLEQTLLYLPAVAVIIAIPGPDMLLSLSRELTQGPLAGVACQAQQGV